VKAARSFCLVFVTTPDLKVARKIARSVLKARLAACANLVPALESHYWWQGKLERAREVLIMFKASLANLSQLEKTVIENHPYDTPEVISFSLQTGNAKYLRWLAQAQRTP
jgi:periplasmic divalent cation tolerance protein